MREFWRKLKIWEMLEVNNRRLRRTPKYKKEHEASFADYLWKKKYFYRLWGVFVLNE